MMQCQKCSQEKQCATLKFCNHNFCYECLCEYIVSNINCKIKCPLDNCQRNIPDQIIRKCLSNLQIEIYEKKGIMSSPNVKKCLTKNCSNFFVIENKESIFLCVNCEQPNCFKCEKRHMPNQCGRNDLDENLIDIVADDVINRKNRELLKSQFLSEDFIPNPDSFECLLCSEFVLPREGLIMRNCLHPVCKECFVKHMKTIEHLNQFTCVSCDKNVHDKEILNSIGISNLTSIIENQAAVKLFCCKFEDCKGLWDSNNLKGCHKCHLCGHINCMACEDIHENMSCLKFRASKKYKQTKDMEEKIKQSNHVTCPCGQVLIRESGCGSLYCNKCGIHVCIFTGKISGNKGENSCGCTSTSPCHVNCTYGCFDE